MDTGENTAHVTGLVNSAFEGNLVDPVTAVKQLSYKLIQVKGDGSVVPLHEEGTMKTKNLSTDAQTDQTSLDDAMYFNMEEADGYLAMGDVPCAFDNCVGKVDCNVLDSTNAHGGKQEIKHEYVDRAFGGAADEGTLHLTSDHQANLLGTASARSSQLNCPSYYGSQRENMSSKREDQCLGTSSNAVKVSDFIVVPESASENKPMLQDDMSSQELQDAFKSSFGQDTCVNNQEWFRHHILFGLQNFTEKDSVPGLFESGLPWQESEDSMILIPGNDLAKSVCCSLINIPEKKKLLVGRSVHQDGHLTEDTVVAAFCEVDGAGSVPVTKNAVVCRKRSRNPPLRYIEESLETDDQYRWRGPEMLSMVDQMVAAVVPRRRRVQRVCPNKNINFIMNGFGGNKARLLSMDSASADTSRSESCDDATYYASLDESSDDSIETFRDETFRKKKNSSRRKNHRQWTLSEITKLIEGVSQCGVGKWTDIKRLLFATSSYRTSVDLKDKWRNLLRASGVPMRSRKQVKPQKNMTVPIPQSILRRVKELANIYPYPRERKLDACDDETSVSQSSKASN